MHLLRILLPVILALASVGLLLALTHASLRAAVLPDDTVTPLSPAQPDVRTAYRDVLAHLYGGGRVHWTASVVPLEPLRGR